jgi:putative transcriptional regulator
MGRVRGFAQRHPVALLLASALVVLGVLPRVIDALKASEGVTPAPAPGLLLVARPGGVSRTFDRTVVLLLEAGEARTWGLVLNRPGPPDGGPLPEGVDRWGGPVHGEYLVTLVPTHEAPGPRARRVLDGVCWYEGPREAPASGGAALTFSGVASWAPGQLQEEVAHGAWWVVDGDARAVFAAPGALWAELAARRL